MTQHCELKYDYGPCAPMQWPQYVHVHVQGSAKRWALGCANSPHVARESQEAGFTQPRDHLITDPCTWERMHDAPLFVFTL